MGSKISYKQGFREIQSASDNTTISTTSNTYVDLTNGSLTIDLSYEAYVQIAYTMSFSSGGGTGTSYKITAYCDADVDIYLFYTPTATGTNGTNMTISSEAEAGLLSAGSHIFKLRWKTAGGTAYCTYKKLTAKIFVPVS